ncbi:MAG: DUF4199 domain-containing protein [Bacteroidales bacterium]|nr:DUF4199 domain-containing protein [Bacteroidales bacterium]
MEKVNKWQSAALAGLILSSVTIIYSLISFIFSPGGFVSTILWAVKFGACIYLLYYLMKQYSSQFDTITYGESFRYGSLVSVFSAIICSCFAFLSITLLFPDQLDKSLEAMQSIIDSGNYNDEQLEAFDTVAGKLPQILLFWSLFYYSIFGVLVSLIIATYTKKTNPFTEDENSIEE